MAINISRHLDSVNIVEAIPLKNLGEKYFCKVCKQLLFNPVQTECGERFCEACANILSSEELMCPIENSKCKYFFDKFANKEILALEFKCPYHGRCNWLGSLSQLKEVHFNTCDYATEVCDNCKEEVIRKDLVEHRLTACAHSFSLCKFCNEEVPAKEKKKHSCLKLPTKCMLGCGATFLKENLISHIEECENSKKSCIYRLIGCKADVSSSLDAHYESSFDIHSRLMMVFAEEMKITQMKLEIELNSLKKENIALHKQLNTASQTIQTIKTELSESYKCMEKQADENASRFAALELLINDLKQVNSKKIPFDDYNQKLSTIESTHEKLNSSFNDLQLSQQILENTSYDGLLLWKISSYRQRSKDALSGVVPALHSAPCYTSRFGYKYCLRLYLNGDGAGKGSYISLFFVLMKSDYDALLKWPFQNRVTFRLRAKNPDNDIVESFVPDKNSSSFSKPIREMNIAAGVPLFAKKSDMNENFIFDDAIYIESKIHL